MNCLQAAYQEAKDVSYGGKELLLSMKMVDDTLIKGTVERMQNDYAIVKSMTGERLFVNPRHVVVVMIEWP